MARSAGGVLEPKQARSVAMRERLLAAAVDELLAVGYADLTTVAVARRAQVTRGAMQHHFPDRETLIAEAIRHLVAHRSDELGSAIEALPQDGSRVRAALDMVFDEFRGQVFSVVLQLALHGRYDGALRPVLANIEEEMAAFLHRLAEAIAPDQAEPWAMAVATIRGICTLDALGYPTKVTDAQWRFARERLVELLAR